MDIEPGVFDSMGEYGNLPGEAGGEDEFCGGEEVGECCFGVIVGEVGGEEGGGEGGAGLGCAVEEDDGVGVWLGGGMDVGWWV